MIEVFDKTRRRVAILENAYAASESPKINSVWYFYFSLPYGDSKNEYCKPFYYVRPDGGELYRIMPETLSVSESGGVSYQCEHVLATLIDNVLFGYHGCSMSAISEINLNTGGSKSRSSRRFSPSSLRSRPL